MFSVLQRRARLSLVAPTVIVALAIAARADMAAQERDGGGVRAPTADLERGRAVYVLNHCHFCHGVDLTRAAMGAANLTQSVLVGADTDGNAIGPLVRAGLPNLQTAMPSYRELTDANIVDLARYVHFLRQQARYRELVAPAAPSPGDATAGRAFFTGAGGCGSCHSVTGDLAGVRKTRDATTLRARLLRPGPAMPADGVPATPGQAAHLKLLENYTLANVQDLMAYLGTID